MNNLPVNVNDLIGGLARTTQTLASDSTGQSFLKLHKGGFFVYGQDETEVEEGSLWAVNPNSFMVGYIAWPAEGTGKPLGEEMRTITEDPLVHSTLPDVGAPWVQQAGFQVMCISGEDTGQQCIFKSSSKGGLRGVNDFLNEVMAHLQANPGTEETVPVLKLEVESYKHSTYGKINTPTFTIQKWVKIDEMPVAEEEDLEPEVDAEPEVAPEPEKKPVRRRRRKAAA